MKTFIATLGVLVLGITPAFAQQATSFDQLQLLVKPGDTVVVTDSAGRSTKGKIQSLTASTMKIANKKELQEFVQGQVLEIRQRRSDPLGNGAAVGGLTGGLVATVGVIAGCRASTGCNAGLAAGAIGAYAGMGAGLGVLIDALVTHNQTIFRGTGKTALQRFDFKPIVAKDRKGAAVAFSF